MNLNRAEITVLAIDDDAAFCTILSHYLSEDPRYQVIATDSAEKALIILSEQQVSAVIADYQMNGMTGLDLLKILRAQGNAVPYFLFTGRGCEDVAITALNEGADFYLVKGEDPVPQFLLLRRQLGEIIARRAADAALRKSERENRRMLSLLKSTLEATESGILVESRDGEIVQLNERLLQITGLGRDEVCGSLRERFVAALLTRLIPEDRGDPDPTGNIPGLLRFQDGRVVETHVHPQFCEGVQVGNVWSFHDLTERITREEELRKSREQLRINFDSSPVSQLLLDENGIIREVNQTLTSILGFSREEVLGKRIEDLGIPSSSGRVRQFLEKTAGCRKYGSTEMVFCRKLGSPAIFLTDGLAISGVDGRIVQIQCTLRDVTGYRRAEERLRWAESFLEEMMDMLPQGICLTQGPDESIRYRNRRFETIWKETEADRKEADPGENLPLTAFFSRPGVEISPKEPIPGDDSREPGIGLSEIHIPGHRILRAYHRDVSEAIENSRNLWVFEDITRFKEQEEEIRNYARKIELFSRIIALSGRAARTESFCSQALGTVIPLMNVKAGVISLTGKVTGDLELIAHQGLSAGEPERFQRIPLSSLPQQVREGRGSVYSEDAEEFFTTLFGRPAPGPSTIIPLISEGVLIGSIILISHWKGIIPADELMILNGIGKEIGQAISRMQVRTELTATRENLQTLVNSITDMVFVVDKENGRILEVNTEVIRHLGYSHRELIGTPIREPSISHQAFFPADLFSDAGGVRDHALITADGRAIMVETSTAIGRWNNSPALFYVSRDISATLAAREQIRQSEARLRALFSSSPVGILLFDEKGRCTDLNKSALNILGSPDSGSLSDLTLSDLQVERDSMPGMGKEEASSHDLILDFFDADTAARFRSNRRDIAEVRVISSPLIHGNSGEVNGFLVLMEDVTHERQVLSLLRESDAFNRSLIANLPDLILLCDTDGLPLFFNPTTSAVLGLHDREENSIPLHHYVIPEQRNQVRRAIERCIRGEEINPFEVRISRVDTSFLDAIMQMIHVPYRGTDAALIVLTDITRRKEFEEKLERYSKSLQSTVDALATANKKLTLLSDVTRHDILNQVHVIVNYLDLVRTEELPGSCLDFLTQIERAIGMIHRQIQFTRSYQALGAHLPEWQNISDLIMLLQPSHLLICNEASGYCILADPLLPKVFENLLDNSVRHGRTATSVRVQAHLAGDGSLLIRWADNGTGIQNGEKERIFQKGYGMNTGFGLFLIREILELTGIGIRETGDPCTGACFEIMVPEGKFRPISS